MYLDILWEFQGLLNLCIESGRLREDVVAMNMILATWLPSGGTASCLCTIIGRHSQYFSFYGFLSKKSIMLTLGLSAFVQLMSAQIWSDLHVCRKFVARRKMCNVAKFPTPSQTERNDEEVETLESFSSFEGLFLLLYWCCEAYCAQFVEYYCRGSIVYEGKVMTVHVGWWRWSWWKFGRLSLLG